MLRWCAWTILAGTFVSCGRVGFERSGAGIASDAAAVNADGGIDAQGPDAATAGANSYVAPGIHSFMVPDAVTSIVVLAWGGGGGGSLGNRGGGGGFASATFAVTPGESLGIGVGQGGSGMCAGGGMSFVMRQPAYLLIAGGGGGAGIDGASGVLVGGNGAGGGGGGAAGEPGGDGMVMMYGAGTGGAGGTPGAPGSGGMVTVVGTVSSSVPTNGASGEMLIGGNGGGSNGSARTGANRWQSGGTGANGTGGGGGAGYYGGGGGSGRYTYWGGGGGGGTSFADPSATSELVAAVGASAANTQNPSYIAGHATGGGVASPWSGGAGLVIIRMYR